MIERSRPGRMLAVLGPYRGGTSAVTGVLRSLGVFVGDSFFDGNTGYLTYEAAALRSTCLSCFDERPRRWCTIGTHAERVFHLHRWALWASSEAAAKGFGAAGGKHPVMCKLIPELEEAWRTSHGEGPLLIAVHRSDRDVLASWERATTPDGEPWWPRDDRAEITRDLIASRDAALATRPHVRVDFSALRRAPRETIEQLAVACGLPLNRVENAVRGVRQSAE